MRQDIYLVGLNHRTAGVETRETFALPEGLPALPPEARLRESLTLSTCNRVEILAVGEGEDLPQRILDCWAREKNKEAGALAPYIYIHQNQEAVRHLFAVASSLDSMVLGEPQILGQLKQAYKEALETGSTKAILNRLLHRAFSVAKRVRSETGVASAAVSVSYAAVELAKRIFGDMGAYKAMLIGAGEMAELAAAHLVNAGIQSVLVANRTHERAMELAARFNGLAVPFENIFQRLPEADIVISSTGSPTAIIHSADVAQAMRRRKNRPMFFIDIAVPRDIDPDVNSLDNIYLYDIDDLKEVVQENLAQRRGEAVKAQAIVEEESVNFFRWLDSLEVQPTIVELYRRAENIADKEWERTMKRLCLDPKSEEAVSLMLRAVIKKLHHDPVAFLQSRAHEASGPGDVALLRRIFNLDKENNA
jgi:glutamyl-tRNA reductase